MKRLTAKEQSFVTAFLACGCKTEAARRSAYATKDDAAATSLGWRLLQRPHVRAEIEAKQKTMDADPSFSAERLIEELNHIALLHPRNVLHDDWTPKTLEQMGDAARAVKKVKIRAIPRKDGPSERITEVEFHDKLNAVDKIARLIGAYDEDRQKEREVDHLAEIRKRLKDAAKHAAPLPVCEEQRSALANRYTAVVAKDVEDTDRNPITGEILP